MKKFFNNQGISPQSRNFSTAKEFFRNQEIFPYSENFSAVKEIFDKKNPTKN